MDPDLTKKYMDQGKLPNIKKFVERGTAREDLVMLGAMPTITPPMWTTLSTGAYPETHGITCFFRQSHEDLDVLLYNFDSRNCQAEQLWDVFAEAGKKTLVWHWPGSSWPPTLDSPNLHVVDGTSPAIINISVALKDWEKIVYASTNVESVLYKPKAASSTGAGCLITDLEIEEESSALSVHGDAGGHRNLELTLEDTGDIAVEKMAFDLVNSPIKEATGWENAPEGAKEFTIVNSKGLVRRPALILKNENGEYERVAVYKSKKEAEPYIIIENDGKISPLVLEEIRDGENTVVCTRSYKILNLSPDGSEVRIWLSNALEAGNDSLWHPKSLYKDVIENVGHLPSQSSSAGTDPFVCREIKEPSWERYTKWQAEALNYVIKHEGYEVVFSHLHNIDSHGHGYWHLCKNRVSYGNDEKTFLQFMENCYVDTDRYIGKFMHLLDEGWSIIITSDHGLVTRQEEDIPLLADPNGVSVPVMEQLGYTAVKKDANGNKLYEIDWENTRAINPRGNFIWVNLKGRNKTGIVDPKDKDELETKIIDDLYSYRDPRTGKRIVSLALKNKDAVILGLSGPETGDIVFFIEEGFIKVHGDSLSTHKGYANTSVSPIFIAAGQGLKKGEYVKRVIREVDVAPTVAILGGVRMPAQCEGAPIYQIFDQDI
jgi:Uncharacterized conserved protein